MHTAHCAVHSIHITYTHIYSYCTIYTIYTLIYTSGVTTYTIYTHIYTHCAPASSGNITNTWFDHRHSSTIPTCTSAYQTFLKFGSGKGAASEQSWKINLTFCFFATFSPFFSTNHIAVRLKGRGRPSGVIFGACSPILSISFRFTDTLLCRSSTFQL